MPSSTRLRNLGSIAALLIAVSAAAEPQAVAISTLPIVRVAKPINVDGDLSDEGWQSAIPVETWFETGPGDNVPPPVKNVGYLAYDERFVYAGLRFDDPEPSRIRAPFGDRDNITTSIDYGGVLLDTRNDGRTAMLFLANARGLQYDAITDDGGGGEDSSPDFYWDAAGKITPTGWTLEIRIPFTSLRYPKAEPQTWGIMLFRNYPRDFRYTFFTNKLPQGSSCFICHSSKVTGLIDLPNAGHIVAAPYVSGSQASKRRDAPGATLDNGNLEAEAGLDLKWSPSAGTAVDVTLNPDFSQVESDVAQISANERFALFYSEKRPFFLEGINLFSTPIQAVHTRTITSPRLGARGTGKWGALAFTALLADDRGGGQVILPGAAGSSFADQDFRSFVALGRLRRDFGASFVSLLASDREQAGGAFNRVVGPDFQWRPNKQDVVTGQFLASFTRAPQRTDLAPAWDGRHQSDHAAILSWTRTTSTYDFYTKYSDLGQDFRAYNGFVPQVGYRAGNLEAGYTRRPKTGLIRRFRAFLIVDYTADRQGDLLSRQISPGFGFDARWYTLVRIRYAWERVRVENVKQTLPRERLFFTIDSRPSRAFPYLNLDGYIGNDVDFDGARRGFGGKVTFGVQLRLSNHLELRQDEEVRWLDAELLDGGRSRLFTARVDRLRATYNFTSRIFVRLIGQYVTTHRDPSLYADSVERHDGALTASVLLAYKLNWQTVLYAGYGDGREISERDRLTPVERSFFIKVSYALQH